MRPHPRIRKTVEWCGAAIAALLISVWIGSNWWGVTWWTGNGGWYGVSEGQVFFCREPRLVDQENVTWWLGRSFGPFKWGWTWWWPASDLYTICLPLWMPVLPVLAVTATAWRLDTLARLRARERACPKCGYSLAGLADGSPCPECGTTDAARHTTAA
jgi:hypothetical protein